MIKDTNYVTMRLKFNVIILISAQHTFLHNLDIFNLHLHICFLRFCVGGGGGVIVVV